MPLTRDFKETIRARVERDPKFRKELLREGVAAMLAGEVATAKIILRDYINATMGFTEPRRSHTNSFEKPDANARTGGQSDAPTIFSRLSASFSAAKACASRSRPRALHRGGALCDLALAHKVARRCPYLTAALNRSRSNPAIISLPATTIGRLIRFGSFAISAIACSAVSDLPASPIALNAGLRVIQKIARVAACEQLLQLRRIQRNLRVVALVKLDAQILTQETSCVAARRSGRFPDKSDLLHARLSSSRRRSCYSIFALDGRPARRTRCRDRAAARLTATTFADVPDAGSGAIGATPPELAVVVVVMLDEELVERPARPAEYPSAR